MTIGTQHFPAHDSSAADNGNHPDREPAEDNVNTDSPGPGDSTPDDNTPDAFGFTSAKRARDYITNNSTDITCTNATQTNAT